MYNDITYPLVSIVMPTYNRAEYILESIESVRRQTHTHWELIIIDDASTDNTEEVVRSVNDSRICYIKVRRFGNSIQLRKIGTQKCKGEFIAFIDSDDIWAENKTEKQLAVFHSYTDAAYSLGGGYNFKVPGTPLEYFYKDRTGIQYGYLLSSLFNSKAAITLPTLMMKAECSIVFEKLKNDLHSDLDFIIELAAGYKGVILQDNLFFRRLHDANMSTTLWQNGYTDMIRVLNKCARENKIPTAVLQNSLYKLNINFGEKHLKYKEYGKAIRRFLIARKNKPFSIVPLKKIVKAGVHLLVNK